MINAIRERKFLQFLLLILVFLVLYHLIPKSDNNWLWRLPPLLKGFPLWINNSVDFLMFEWWPVEVWDPDLEEFEQKPLVREFTRSISAVILFMIEFIREILLGGVKTIVTFTSWDWATANP